MAKMIQVVPQVLKDEKSQFKTTPTIIRVPVLCANPLYRLFAFLQHIS